MKTYAVTIKTTITKTYTIEAQAAAEAEATAHDIFTTDCDETPERYQQETIDIEETSATDETRSNGPHQTTGATA
jgi:hypothetical protein